MQVQKSHDKTAMDKAVSSGTGPARPPIRRQEEARTLAGAGLLASGGFATHFIGYFVTVRVFPAEVDAA